jgi:hypothetical protein
MMLLKSLNVCEPVQADSEADGCSYNQFRESLCLALFLPSEVVKTHDYMSSAWPL